MSILQNTEIFYLALIIHRMRKDYRGSHQKTKEIFILMKQLAYSGGCNLRKINSCSKINLFFLTSVYLWI